MKNKELINKLESLDLEMVKYYVDENLDSDESYISDVASTFARGISLDTAINETLDKYVDTNLQILAENSVYIESDIDEYLNDAGANSFRTALIGGQCNYYKRQLYKNSGAVYTNTLIEVITDLRDELLKDISNQVEISEYTLKDKLPLIYAEHPMGMIENFVLNIDENSGVYCSIDDIDVLVRKFNEFVNSGIYED